MSSYLVIARKWRPALFEEIVGQEHVTRTLRNAVSSGRTAHAYLFSGPRGVGKTTAARILAKSLNCERGPTPEPCNECTSCTSIVAGSSVDVFEIDGASNTGVDNVRELRESVRYVPTQGRYKVYIIDEVHMLSTPAFNALLKTLEEPPPHAVFIFATTEVHKIPLTILSRCQRFDFKRIPFKEIERHLEKIVTKESIKFAPGVLATIAREADGSLRDAQSLLDQVLAFAGDEVTETDVADALGLMDRTILVELLGSVVARDPVECLNIVEKIYNFGYDLKRACSDLLEYIRDITVIKVSGDTGLLEVPDAEADRLRSIADQAGLERLHLLFSVVSKGYEEVSRSALPRYCFEMAVLRAAHLEDVQPIGAIISKLESLGGRAGVTGAPPGRGPSAGKPRASCAPGPSSGRGSAPHTPGPETGDAQSRQGHGAVKAGEPDPPSYDADAASAEAVDEPGVRDALAAGQDPDDLAGFIKKKITSLVNALKSAELFVDGDNVTIRADKRSCLVFNMKKEQVESACSEHLGRRVRVCFEVVDTPEPEEKDQTDPLVKEAVRIFGGRVIEDRRRQNV